VEWWQSAICAVAGVFGVWEALLSVGAHRSSPVVWISCPPCIALSVLVVRTSSSWIYFSAYVIVMASNALLYSGIAFLGTQALRRGLVAELPARFAPNPHYYKRRDGRPM